MCLGLRGRGGGLGLGRTVAFIPESDEKALRSFEQGSDWRVCTAGARTHSVVEERMSPWDASELLCEGGHCLRNLFHVSRG